MRFFSEDHVWVEMADGTCTLGLSSYAAEELGELTFVELPAIGTSFSTGDVLCVVESVKAASDVICPIGGTVSEVNSLLDISPGLVNAHPENEGWICRLEEVDDSELDALMTDEEYDLFLESTLEN